MKKGSKARKCRECGQIIFWEVPSGYILGLQFASIKKVKEYKYIRERLGYVCIDCLNKDKK